MLTFSQDPETAERQMQAILFYLTTFGYIDGEFDDAEKSFVRDYIDKLIRHRVEQAMPDAEAGVRQELIDRFGKHFREVFENIDTHVHDLFNEPVESGEDQHNFVHAKLKQRCFEIFQSFDEDNQHLLLDTVDEFIHADGEVHPAEIKFRNELSELLEADLGVELVEGGEASPVDVKDRASRVIPEEAHPFFERFEFHYSKDPDLILKQVEADRELLATAMNLWEGQAKAGAGVLTGKRAVREIEGHQRVLDGHVYGLSPDPNKNYELLVLGDLHGCYSNLKAAILQGQFFDRVAAYKASPETAPMPILVLLGDYIDRGLFSLNGVLRTVLQLMVTAPEHVVVLRGNHEYFVEFKGRIYGGVKPAEAINTLKPHVPEDVFRDYQKLFDRMPTSFLFGGVLFTHGGIPRDRLIKERFMDLTFLNDADVRFQMMWSDPSTADVIPAKLQEQTARFPFGTLQAKAFLQKIGCHTLIRGHERVDNGFKEHFRDDDIGIFTVFSAGGTSNDDLPADSSYRSVVPHALSIHAKGGQIALEPWEIQYELINHPDWNGFFKAPPEISHVAK